MNKISKIFLITVLINIFFNTGLYALEILEVKIIDSYKVSRDFPGKLLPSEQSKLAFEIPGKIKLINVDVGDKVRKGDVLVELDDREALAQLNQSKAKYDLASQVLNRFKDLRTKGHISIQDLDNANSEELIAKSQYEFYKVKFEQTKLLAPFDGVIQDRYLDTGSVINGGIPIIEILDSKNVKANISIPISYIDKIKIGESYNFEISNISTQATLQRLAPMSLGGSNNRLAVFVFDTFFNPGSVAILKLTTIEQGRGTWVPIKSLSQSEQGVWAIYTINDQKKVTRDLVDIIYFEGEYAFVNGTLKNGDLIILGGAQKIIEGKQLD
jgi:RND family efflux transporter MFP subunit